MVSIEAKLCCVHVHLSVCWVTWCLLVCVCVREKKKSGTVRSTWVRKCEWSLCTLIHSNYSEADSNLQLTVNFFIVSVGHVCPLGIAYPRSIHLYLPKCWSLYYICYSLFLNVYFMFHVLVRLIVTCGSFVVIHVSILCMFFRFY